MTFMLYEKPFCDSSALSAESQTRTGQKLRGTVPSGAGALMPTFILFEKPFFEASAHSKNPQTSKGQKPKGQRDKGTNVQRTKAQRTKAQGYPLGLSVPLGAGALVSIFMLSRKTS